MAQKIVLVDKSPMNILPGGIAGAAIVAGNLVYMDSNGAWQLADQVAYTDTTRKDALGVAWKDAQANEFMSPARIARIRVTGGSYTIGGKIYLSDTAGGFTQTEPTANVRQCVGFANKATEVFIGIGGAAGAPADVGGDEQMDALVLATTLAVGTTSSFGDDIVMADEANILTNATTGTYIAAADDKLAFWAATPVVQQAHIADPAASSAPTAVAVGDLVAVQSTGWGATAEADFDKIGTNIDALVIDVAANKVAIDANNAAIDSLNALCATIGLTAAA